MRNWSVTAGLVLALISGSPAAAQPQTWIVATDLWGNPSYQSLHIDNGAGARGSEPGSEHRGELRGDLDGDQVTGSRTGGRVSFSAASKAGAVYRFVGEVRGPIMSGVADFPDTNNPGRRASHRFTARLVPQRPAAPPQRHEFAPKDYANVFSAERAPVLHVWPGDTVHTRTIDSGGVDETGATVALFGNPQVGPFFVVGAEPGDTLVVRLRKLTLNRDYADSLDSIVGRAMTARLAGRATELGKPVRWKLDRARGVARPQSAGGSLRDLALPVGPMLGGLAVAPGFGSPPMSTGDTGTNGGNMDFNEVAQGAAVLLPVLQPGALLYLGDAHALQGDGEITQFALETSMDVEFTVDLVKGRSVPMPRVESALQIMVLGQAGSVDDALKAATSGMTIWLEQDYGLTLSDSAQLLGAAAKYAVVNLAGRSVGVALKIDKSVLAQLHRPAR